MLSALGGLLLLLLLALAPSAGARAAGIPDAAAALKQGPVYVDPGAADQLSQAEANALAQKIKDADKPLLVAVLPASAEFPRMASSTTCAPRPGSPACTPCGSVTGSTRASTPP